MKILELRLTAFGPFTDRVLDLSAGNHGLHVIFGPNEAGKSSALRALHAALYGIPAQTDDAFLHPYARLRVGARLRLSSGHEIEFSRRKATKGSLLGPGDEPLDDHSIDRFLGGVGPEHFRMLWGIDHACLVDGGREILEGRGDLGEILFAAGSGASRLGSLRKKLNEEAEALFVPRGQHRAVNQAIAHLRTLRSDQRSATVSADEWTRQERAVRDSDEQVARLTQRIQELFREKSRLERLKRVLPLLAERAEVRRRLDGLGEVILLSTDFPERRHDAEAALRTAQRELERSTRELGEQEETVAKLGTTPLLASETEAVNTLFKSLGSHRKALSDRPKLVAQCADQRGLAKHLLGELRPDFDADTAESLRVFVGRRVRIQKLAAERERLDERFEIARGRLNEAQKKAEVLEREASSLPPWREPEKLVAAIEEARRRGDAEAQRVRLAQTVKRTVAQCNTAIEKLQLPTAVIDKLNELRVPTAATIARFERKAQQFEDEARTAKIERQRLGKRTRDLDTTIETLHSKKAVPTEEDLTAARTRRDAAFSLLRNQWEKGRDVTVEARTLLGKGKLIDLYPGMVKTADELADRLRGEADRVVELAQHLEERKRNVTELEEAEADSRQREKAITELDIAWRSAWDPVLGDPPQIHEARAWCEDFNRLVERMEAVRTAQHEQLELDEWIEGQVKSLRAVMTAIDPSKETDGGLSMVLASAQRLRQQIEKEQRIQAEHARKTGETEQAIRDSSAAVVGAQADIERWQAKWDEATRGLVQGDTPPPDDALVAIDRVEKIRRAIDDAAGYEARITGIDRDADSFRTDAYALAERLGEADLIRRGSEDAWVDTLHKRLEEVLQEDERRRQAGARRDQLKEEVAREKDSVAATELTLSAIREEASCGVEGDLVMAERRSAELRGCQSELERIEKELLRSGDGVSIIALETEAASADRDAIGARLDQIGTESLEVEKELAEARDERASAREKLRQLAEPSTAIEKAEEIQATLAQLRGDVVQYARLRLASTLLARRIDDYRRNNQAPLLLRAAEIFHEMTLGSFEGLEADLEEDRPILVGVRPGGERVPSHGMSKGTRDQLFFALRLAAVEKSCAGTEPLPFVVDDVLVQFDDNRSAAALRVLADVASHTQIVLFTHHSQVRTCAEAMTASGEVVVHEL